MATLSDADRHDLETLIHNYGAALTTMDSAAIAEFWVIDEPVFYIAEEIADPMIGWSAVAAYWDKNRSIMSRLAVILSNIRCHLIGSDFAAVLYALHWDGALGPDCLGGDVSASGILRRTASGWKFVHYTESALGPLPFLQQIYRKAVSPAFLAAIKSNDLA